MDVPVLVMTSAVYDSGNVEVGVSMEIVWACICTHIYTYMCMCFSVKSVLVSVWRVCKCQCGECVSVSVESVLVSVWRVCKFSVWRVCYCQYGVCQCGECVSVSAEYVSVSVESVCVWWRLSSDSNLCFFENKPCSYIPQTVASSLSRSTLVSASLHKYILICACVQWITNCLVPLGTQTHLSGCMFLYKEMFCSKQITGVGSLFVVLL